MTNDNSNRCAHCGAGEEYGGHRQGCIVGPPKTPAAPFDDGPPKGPRTSPPPGLLDAVSARLDGVVHDIDSLEKRQALHTARLDKLSERVGGVEEMAFTRFAAHAKRLFALEKGAKGVAVPLFNVQQKLAALEEQIRGLASAQAGQEEATAQVVSPPEREPGHTIAGAVAVGWIHTETQEQARAALAKAEKAPQLPPPPSKGELAAAADKLEYEAVESTDYANRFAGVPGANAGGSGVAANVYATVASWLRAVASAEEGRGDG